MDYGVHDIWKGNFINELIKECNFESYLELGVHQGWSWNRISCSKKVGVDIQPLFEGITKSTTDDFLEKCTDKFDVIYIDAWHDKINVFRDFLGSFKILKDDGVILFHDINPANESSTSVLASGTAFEFWIELCKYAKTQVYVNHDGDALGLFSKQLNPHFEPTQLNSEFAYTWQNFLELKNEVIDSRFMKLQDFTMMLK